MLGISSSTFTVPGKLKLVNIILDGGVADSWARPGSLEHLPVSSDGLVTVSGSTLLMLHGWTIPGREIASSRLNVSTLLVRTQNLEL
jgi:hypothetical protein